MHSVTALIFIKQKLQGKEKLNKHTLKIEDFHSPLTEIDKSTMKNS